MKATMDQSTSLSQSVDDALEAREPAPEVSWFARWLEPAALAALFATAAFTYWLIERQGVNERLLSPPIVALLLVLNLVPAIAILVLIGRRIARRRALRGLVGGDGRLHVRLVGLFFAHRQCAPAPCGHLCIIALSIWRAILVFRPYARNASER